MKLKLNKDKCIGCGACEAIAPDYFQVIGGVCSLKKSEVKKEDEESVKEAIECCPTQAIKNNK